MENNTVSSNRKSENGNAVIVVLVVLVVVAVAALAYLSGQMVNDERSADDKPALTSEMAEADDASEAKVDAAADAEDTAKTQVADASDKTEAFVVEEGNPIVAIVSGKDITRQDVLDYIQNLPPNIQQLPLEQLFPLAQEQVVNSVILDSNVDEESLMKKDDVRKQVEASKEQILRAAYVQEQLHEKLTDARLKQAYDKYAEEFDNVEEVRARHILVSDEDLAKTIINKLNTGAEFEALAKESSIDSTATRGGDLGFFAKSDVVPEFGDAAYALSDGEYTKEPVQSQFGFHIIKKIESRKRPTPSFEETKTFLEGNLRREILDEMMMAWRETSDIERFDINGNPIAEDASEKGAQDAPTDVLKDDAPQEDQMEVQSQ